MDRPLALQIEAISSLFVQGVFCLDHADNFPGVFDHFRHFSECTGPVLPLYLDKGIQEFAQLSGLPAYQARISLFGSPVGFGLEQLQSRTFENVGLQVS